MMLVAHVAATRGQDADSLRRDRPDSAQRSQQVSMVGTTSRKPPTVVIVRGSSIASRVARAPQATAIVSARELSVVGGNDLSDAISRTPGVFVRSYGGLGGLKTLSLRGTSAQQSVVLIDGVRYQGTAAGALDLGNVPLESMERVEVMRGGGASLYGANALGGVVNVVTRTSGPSRCARVALDVGSFGEQGMDLALSTGTATERWSLVADGRRSDGDYTFDLREFGQTRAATRSNSDASRLYARVGWNREFAGGDEVTIAAQGVISERGVPGAVVQGNVEQARARLDEREYFALARHEAGIDDWQLIASATARLHRLHYRDPDARYEGPQGIDDSYIRHELALSIRARRVAGDAGVLDLFVETSREGIDGDNLDPALTSEPRRSQVSAGGSLNWFFDKGESGWETLVEGSVRGDAYDDVAGAISPSAGIVVRLARLPVRMRARVAAAYRTPSFAEQYYLNYGNASLRPERSISMDVGATVDLDPFVIEAGCFAIDTRDQIASVPRSPVSWSARNIAHIRSRGMEIGVAGNLFDTLLSVRGSYTLMGTRDLTDGPTCGKLLPYAPQELASLLVDVAVGDISAHGSATHVGHRFTLANEDAASALPHYILCNVGIAWRSMLWSLTLTSRLELENLFDVDYQVIRNYPMPGRNLRLRFGFQTRGEDDHGSTRQPGGDE